MNARAEVRRRAPAIRLYPIQWAIAAARRRAAAGHGGADCDRRAAVSMGDDTYSGSVNRFDRGLAGAPTDIPRRTDSDGHRGLYESCADADTRIAHTYLRAIAGAESSRRVPDLNPEGLDVRAAGAAAPDRNAGPALPSAARRRVHRPGRAGAVADADAYSGIEYDQWVE
jgi:hypothetical protein